MLANEERVTAVDITMPGAFNEAVEGVDVSEYTATHLNISV